MIKAEFEQKEWAALIEAVEIAAAYESAKAAQGRIYNQDFLNSLSELRAKMHVSALW